MRRRPSPHLLIVLVLLLAACGSRADTSEADDDLGGEDQAQDGGGGEGGGALGPDSEELGSVPNPCGGEAAGGGPTDTPGVTDDTIRIGVISDKENDLAPVPTIGVEEAVRAFVDLCNEAGGINGRELELLTYDSEVLRTDDVTKEACADDLFALVGSGSVQDQLGVETRIGCGLPEVAAYSATSTRSESDLFFQPIPGTKSHFFNVGPCRFIAERHPEAVTRAAILYTDLPAASTRAAQMRDLCEAEAGFEFVVDQGIPFGSTSFGPVVSQMKDQGVRYFTMVSAASDTLAILRELAAQGVELEVIDLGQQYYDNAVADDGSAEGAYVLTNTVPFSEADEHPMLGLYLDRLEAIGASEAHITTLGVQAFSAALLWATATDALGADVTREGLVTELEGIEGWDGGGLHMTADPGTGAHNECFLYLRLTDGEFVREHPDEGFSCEPGDVIETEQAYEG